MPVFDSHKLIFIHIPKNGGESIYRYMGYPHLDHRKPNNTLVYGVTKHFCLQHLTCNQMVKHGFVSPEKFQEYYKFAIVRNPYDRLVSEYFWKGMNWQERYNSFEKFVRALPKLMKLVQYAHFIPQHQFITDNNDNIIVDDVLRFENYSEQISGLLSKFNIEADTNKKYNHSQRGSYEQYYTDDLKKIVQQYYEKDFEMFGYDM